MEKLDIAFLGKLYDAGKIIDEKYTGILTPKFETFEIKKYISPYYETQENADRQADEFDMTDYYYTHISNAIEVINPYFVKDSFINVLDIGCGFGSTTFPLLKLFPNAQIVACELSLSMLYILKKRLDSSCRKKVNLFQLNAEELNFANSSFDIVVGAAILHHLIDPGKVFKHLERILKQNGFAVFFEPFENGTSILGLIYKSIVEHNNFKKLQKTHQEYFKNCISTWQKMKNLDKSDSFFQGTDDKWIFTQHWFMKTAEKYAFNRCIIKRLDVSENPFMTLAKTHFKGNNIVDLPEWVNQIIMEYERWFSSDLKHDLLTEGCIIMVK